MCCCIAWSSTVKLFVAFVIAAVCFMCLLNVMIWWCKMYCRVLLSLSECMHRAMGITRNWPSSRFVCPVDRKCPFVNSDGHLWCLVQLIIFAMLWLCIWHIKIHHIITDCNETLEVIVIGWFLWGILSWFTWLFLYILLKQDYCWVTYCCNVWATVYCCWFSWSLCVM